MFNNPESACRTCGGLGVHKVTHPELLVPDPKRSIRGGCFVRRRTSTIPTPGTAASCTACRRCCEFSLDTPWEKLPETVRHAILYGLEGKKVAHHAAARCQGEARRVPRPRSRLPRNCAPHREAIPALSAARRGKFRNGSVARQGDGRAHLSGLQGRAPARYAAAVHHRRQDNPRCGRICISTNCTGFSAA